MTTDFEDNTPDVKPKSHWLLWLLVSIFLVLAVAGMWSIDYFFSPEAIAGHSAPAAVDD